MRDSRKRQSKCRETCGSTRKRLGKCRGTCAACANASANAAGLARLAQTSRQMPRDLRGLRKRLGKYRGTCAACANAKANAGRVAGLPQTSKRMPGDLREYPQTPRSSSRHLQQCCRHFQKRFGRASVETLCGLYSYTELTLRKRSSR